MLNEMVMLLAAVRGAAAYFTAWPERWIQNEYELPNMTEVWTDTPDGPYFVEEKLNFYSACAVGGINLHGRQLKCDERDYGMLVACFHETNSWYTEEETLPDGSTVETRYFNIPLWNDAAERTVGDTVELLTEFGDYLEALCEWQAELEGAVVMSPIIPLLPAPKVEVLRGNSR